MKIIEIKNRDKAAEVIHWILNYNYEQKSLFLDVKERPRNIRRLQQNNFYWMCLDRIKKHIYESTGQLYKSTELHEYFKLCFLPTRTVNLPGKSGRATTTSTTGLSVGEMAEYISQIDMYCASELNLVLPTPEATWQQQTAIS